MATKTAERDQEMFNLYKQGKTFQEIADKYSISRQRVQQCISHLDGYGTETLNKTRTQAQVQQKKNTAARTLETYGKELQELSKTHTKDQCREIFRNKFPNHNINVFDHIVEEMNLIFNTQMYNDRTTELDSLTSLWLIIGYMHKGTNENIDIESTLGTDAKEIKKRIKLAINEKKVANESLHLVACGKKYVETHDNFYITHNKYDIVRKEFLDSLQQDTRVSHISWPVSSQTVCKRLGNRVWNDALFAAGINPRTKKKFNDKRNNDIKNKVLQSVNEFYVETLKNDTSFTSQNYDKWSRQKRDVVENRNEYPCLSTVYNVYGRWNNVKREVLQENK